MKLKPVLIIGLLVIGVFVFSFRNTLFSGDECRALEDNVKSGITGNITLVSDSSDSGNQTSENMEEKNTNDKVIKSEEEWKKELTDEEYRVLREKGTERPFTGKYNDFKDEGLFTCNACNNPVFYSTAKFESGCGWPSFFEPVTEGSIVLSEDRSHGMVRTEVTCGKCGSHLGHVFDDGPPPTGKRYCINSVSLEFKPEEEGK
ncbi:MAG TPA: peptide-methionine (R)-S-oxide reductase MsrB [Ignavibacteria bacterium]|nr:peptide-methionine (R)-S-oxide reductase MsrB [Ignavibacteria bacterium]